jgi:hypothetical protein
VHDRAFNVGQTEENYRISEVAEIVEAVVPGSRVQYAEGGGPDLRCYRVNCDRLAELVPAYRPAWTVQRGVEELFEAFTRHSITVEDFESSRFLRLKHVRELQEQGMLDEQLRRREPALEGAGA